MNDRTSQPSSTPSDTKALVTEAGDRPPKRKVPLAATARAEGETDVAGSPDGGKETQELPVLASGPPPSIYGGTSGRAPSEIDDDEFDDADDLTAVTDRSRTRSRKVTATLALLAAIGIGFASGVIYQKHQGSSPSSGSSAFSALRSRFASLGAGGSSSKGGFPGLGSVAGGGAPTIGGFGGGGTTDVRGTVSAISGTTLYVSDGASSALVKVVTKSTSTVTVPQTAPVGSVQPGDTVNVTGAKQKDGSFVAATITDSGSPAATTGTGSAGAAAAAAGTGG